MSGKQSLTWLVKAFQKITTGDGARRTFDQNLNKVKITAGGNGSVSAVMKVEDEHTNQVGLLHGAMIALIVDTMSAVALATHSASSAYGVSVNMNIDYTKACKVGEEILIKATSDKIGKRLAYLQVNIYHQGTGDLIAKGSHIKFIG